MKTFIVLLLAYIVFLPVVGFSAEKRLVHMPEGYTRERTGEFIKKTIGSDEFRQNISSQFPTMDNYKGTLRCVPVWTKSITNLTSGSAILCKTKGFEKWSEEEDFISYAETYIKEKIVGNSLTQGKGQK